MGESARVRLIRAAQSGELREAFRQLAEIEGPRGPKFPHRVLLGLAARIVGRAYEPMLLELCHLVRAAVLADVNTQRYGRPNSAGGRLRMALLGRRAGPGRYVPEGILPGPRPA